MKKLKTIPPKLYISDKIAAKVKKQAEANRLRKVIAKEQRGTTWTRLMRVARIR